MRTARKATVLMPVVDFSGLMQVCHQELHQAEPELQKSHRYAGITREEGLQNGQPVRKVSCQHTRYCILNTNIKKLIDDLFQKIMPSS